MFIYYVAFSFILTDSLGVAAIPSKRGNPAAIPKNLYEKSLLTVYLLHDIYFLRQGTPTLRQNCAITP